MLVPPPIQGVGNAGGVDLTVDGGELPGTPSTVVDLRAWERDGVYGIARLGAVAEDEVARALNG